MSKKCKVVLLFAVTISFERDMYKEEDLTLVYMGGGTMSPPPLETLLQNR